MRFGVYDLNHLIVYTFHDDLNCLTCLADCGADNVTIYMSEPDNDLSRLPTANAECGFCKLGSRFDSYRQECVRCSQKVSCKNSKLVRFPCQDMTQYFDHNEEACLPCPENFVCASLSNPRPKEEFNPQTRLQLASAKKILLPYWIDESNSNTTPHGKECFSKRKDDRNANCDVRIHIQKNHSVHTCTHVPEQQSNSVVVSISMSVV